MCRLEEVGGGFWMLLKGLQAPHSRIMLKGLQAPHSSIMLALHGQFKKHLAKINKPFVYHMIY